MKETTDRTDAPQAATHPLRFGYGPSPALLTAVLALGPRKFAPQAAAHPLRFGYGPSPAPLTAALAPVARKVSAT
ncbi:hypothetical protein AB0I66_12505 [Streptomyces sp. NPDC050439]|uniref:hypothetical protein n=1 Tax=unclassified Streptomyces TaxID=2593676 RepID=UPI00343BBFB5